MVLAINIDQGLQAAWNDIATIVPRLFACVVILVLGIGAARLIALGVERLLRRAGFDRAVERGGIQRALARSRYDATALACQVVFLGLSLVVLQFAFGMFGENPVSDMLASVVAYLPKVFAAIVIVVVAAAVAAACRDVVGSALSSTTYGNVLATIAAGMVVTIGVFAALDQLDIAPAVVLGVFYALLAIVAGSAVVAIGGGGIQPMRARWERALERIENEAPNVRERARDAMHQRHVDLIAAEARETAMAMAQTESGATTQELRPNPPPERV